MKALFSLRAIPMLVALVMVTSCGLGTDDEPTALSVPKEVFPPDAKEEDEFDPVSYTHMTLPTIYSV